MPGELTAFPPDVAPAPFLADGGLVLELNILKNMVLLSSAACRRRFVRKAESRKKNKFDRAQLMAGPDDDAEKN